MDHYRKPQPEPLQESHPYNPEIPNHLEDLDEKKQLADLVKGLDEERQELLRLRFAAELSFEEIALIDGRNTAAVKMAIYRTVDQLRKRWEQTDE